MRSCARPRVGTIAFSRRVRVWIVTFRLRWHFVRISYCRVCNRATVLHSTRRDVAKNQSIGPGGGGRGDVIKINVIYECIRADTKYVISTRGKIIIIINTPPRFIANHTKNPFYTNDGFEKRKFLTCNFRQHHATLFTNAILYKISLQIKCSLW